ncbi:MAG: ornithine cyclodeaminase family protein [Hyphomonadaceae bacterium]
MTLLLTRADIASLMTPAHYLKAAEHAFAADFAGAPPPMNLPGVGGAFHAKGATLWLDRPVAALKLNGNFPANPQRGLPTIQGVLLLCDAENGAVLAIMDSGELTLGRTAAATALAAKHLARADSAAIAVCGAGAQAPAQIEALTPHLSFEAGAIWDVDTEKAARLAARMSDKTGFPWRVAASPREAVANAPVVVACTTATEPYLDANDIAAGAFIAAVGADSPAKSELTPALMARAKIVTDITAQCAVMGDLHHALDAGALGPDAPYGELAEIVSGRKPGRRSEEEIFVFDSTGFALQDAAAATLIVSEARARGAGAPVSLT